MIKDNKPLVSVIMPVYNGELYLDEAIQSILTQTYKNFEFIIINDGSTDNSLDIIKKYMNKDTRIFLINRENKGLIYSLNEGIKKAKGKYIARMDADDISLPARFEKQIEVMESNALDICGCHYFEVNENLNYESCFIVPISTDSFRYYLSNTTPFAHPSVIIRKAFLLNNNLLYGQTQYHSAEDYALWISFWDKKAKFGNVDQFLFKYRNFTNSLSKTNKSNIAKDRKEISRKFILNENINIIDSLKSIKCNLKSKLEREYIVMTIFQLFKLKFSFQYIKLLRQCDMRSIICGFFKFIKKM